MVSLALGIVLGIVWFRDPERARLASPALRGRAVAARLGCFGCHGPDGVAGIPNPGSRTGEVPAWSGGTYMMFNESPGEIREWILEGAPARLHNDPEEWDRWAKQLISMPAYKGRVEGSDLDDLVSYVQAVSAAFRPEPDSAAAEGRRLAVAHGCFGCHGPEGRGLIRNPGSLKGFIPPWDSDDYTELVRGPEEFREWVETGEIRRFRDNPAAAHFLDAQVIKMPGFKDEIEPDGIEKIREYVEWVRSRPRSGAGSAESRR